MASAGVVSDVFVLLPFNAQLRGIRLYEVDFRRLVPGKSTCGEEKSQTICQVMCIMCDIHVMTNKHGVSFLCVKCMNRCLCDRLCQSLS